MRTDDVVMLQLEVIFRVIYDILQTMFMLSNGLLRRHYYIR